MLEEASVSNYIECVSPEEMSSLRQGDIFEWITSKGRISRFGLVVTANCDLVHAKHRGIVSYVPLIEWKEHLRESWLPLKIRKAAKTNNEKMVGLMRKAQKENCIQEFPNILSEEAIFRWVSSGNIKSIVSTLRMKPCESEQFSILASRLLEVNSLENLSFESMMGLLEKLRADVGVSEEAFKKGIVSEAQDYLCHLPGDLFFINAIKDELKEGYIANLRLIREIDERLIALKYTHLTDSEVLSKRIASLGLPFLHRLTQQLGDVFAAIGLPEEYENARGRVAQSIR